MKYLLSLASTSLFALSILTAAAASLTQDMQGVLLPPSADGVATVLSDKWSWSSCGSPDDLVEVTSLEVSPDPPEPGKNLTVNVKGTVKQQIEEGAYADVTVKLGLITLLKKTLYVCEEARKANATLQCPVAEDDYVVSQTVMLPKEIPKAKFTVKVDAYSVDDDPLLCLDIKIDFMKRFSMPNWLGN